MPHFKSILFLISRASSSSSPTASAPLATVAYTHQRSHSPSVICALCKCMMATSASSSTSSVAANQEAGCDGRDHHSIAKDGGENSREIVWTEIKRLSRRRLSRCRCPQRTWSPALYTNSIKMQRQLNRGFIRVIGFNDSFFATN